jgi:hypothetical protein
MLIRRIRRMLRKPAILRKFFFDMSGCFCRAFPFRGINKSSSGIYLKIGLWVFIQHGRYFLGQKPKAGVGTQGLGILSEARFPFLKRLCKTISICEEQKKTSPRGGLILFPLGI